MIANTLLINTVFILTVWGADPTENNGNESRQVEDKNEQFVKRLSELERFLLPISDDQRSILKNITLERYLPVTSTSTECRDHSLLILEALQKQQLWAFRMVDASTKLFSGVLDGHFEDLGHYEQCVDVYHPDELFSGQHCVIQTEGFLDTTMQMKVYTTDITFSLCVPSSCSLEDVANHVDSFLSEINATTVFTLLKQANSIYLRSSGLTCSTDPNKSRFRLEDYVALMFLLAAASYIVIISICESRYNCKIARSDLSIRSNFNLLMDTKISSNEISCLNGLRVLFIMSIVVYHRLTSILIVIPTYRRAAITKEYSLVPFRFMDALTFTLDGFFMIGGVLTSYTYFMKKNKSDGSIIKQYINRYFRMTPTLAVIIMIYATQATHLSQGPLWSRVQEECEKPCRNNWWSNLLQISNYYGDKVCVGQSWYVACDFQLFLLSPLMLIPLSKKPKAGIMLIIAVILTPPVIRVVWSYAQQLYPLMFYNVIEATYRPTIDGSQIHYRGFHFRIGFYALGILLGYILSAIKDGKLENKLSKPLFSLGWTAAAIATLVYFGTALALFHPEHIYHSWLDPLFNGFGKTIMCLNTAWLIFACALGHGGVIDSFLSWNVFRPLAKLTFGVFMIHELVIIVQIASRQVPLAYTRMTWLTMTCSDTVLSFSMAVILFLFVEMPCFRLANSLLKGKPKNEGGNITEQISPHITDFDKMESTKM